MARVLGLLYSCGALLALAWTALPHGGREGDPVVVTMAAVALAMGVVMAVGPTQGLPLWSFHVVIAVWTAACLAGSLVVVDAPPMVALRVWLMTIGTVAAVGSLVSIVAGRLRDVVGGSVVELLVDLDHFKLVNDTYGHHVGDRLLAEVAPRLVGAVRAGDVVARMGGDEFAVVCADPGGQLDLGGLLSRLEAAWTDPVTLEPGRLHVSGSVGVVRGVRADDTAESLLRDADVALYRAKSVQRGSIVDLASGRPVGAKALLRWTSPSLGPVPPAEFVPLAEARGLIIEIGGWVLEEASRVLAGWRAAGVVDDDFALAINVSGRQVRPGFAATVRAALGRYDVPARSLHLEITESVLLDDSLSTTRALAELRATGVPLFLDDFGTGYSSLSYLQRLPLAGLKIDKSFVDGVDTSARRRTVVAAMADGLDMDVVAEGVESAEVAEALAGLGCRQAQGYHWSRPEAVREFANRLREWDVPVTDSTYRGTVRAQGAG
jgi:diguanylate cyclase (GGDEF)-like protein